MNIVIAGCGNVGYNLAEILRNENHEVTLIDTDSERLKYVVDTLDVRGVADDVAKYEVLADAGVSKADIFIAVTNQDEVNMLGCLMATSLGKCKTIARVRSPIHYGNMWHIKDKLGLSMYVNPEMEAAREMERLIQLPSALDIDVFRKSNVNVISFKLPEKSFLVNMQIKDIKPKLGAEALVAIVERGDEIVIPNGTFSLKANDVVSVVLPIRNLDAVMKTIGLEKNRIKSVMVAGGGRIAFYLVNLLLKSKSGMDIKIIEKDFARCEHLSELLPGAKIIHGNLTNKELLLEEGIQNTDAFVSVSENDEENIMLSLYAKKLSKAKVITKIKNATFEEIIDDLDVGSVVEPKKIVAESIVSYVRGLKGTKGNNIETLYKLKDEKVEAIEFAVTSEIKGLVGVKLSHAKLKENILICSIYRGNKTFIPGGNDIIELGDRVIVVAKAHNLMNLKEILNES